MLIIYYLSQMNKEKERFFTIDEDGKVEILWLDVKEQINLNEEIKKSMEKR